MAVGDISSCTHRRAGRFNSLDSIHYRKGSSTVSLTFHLLDGRGADWRQFSHLLSPWCCVPVSNPFGDIEIHGNLTLPCGANSDCIDSGSCFDGICNSGSISSRNNNGSGCITNGNSSNKEDGGSGVGNSRSC